MECALFNTMKHKGVIFVMMNYSYTEIFFAPPPWKPVSDRVNLVSEEGVKHLPSSKEGVF